MHGTYSIYCINYKSTPFNLITSMCGDNICLLYYILKIIPI